MAIVVEDPLVVGTGLDLRAVWLNAADNLADLISLPYAGEALAITTSRRGEVRQLVGRRRIVRRGGRAYESFSITFEWCTREQVQWFRNHVGELLCIRDHVGSKAYVAYFEAPREVHHLHVDRTTVKLTLDEVDHTEAV